MDLIYFGGDLKKKDLGDDIEVIYKYDKGVKWTEKFDPKDAWKGPCIYQPTSTNEKKEGLK